MTAPRCSTYLMRRSWFRTSHVFSADTHSVLDPRPSISEKTCVCVRSFTPGIIKATNEHEAPLLSANPCVDGRAQIHWVWCLFSVLGEGFFWCFQIFLVFLLQFFKDSLAARIKNPRDAADFVLEQETEQMEIETFKSKTVGGLIWKASDSVVICDVSTKHKNTKKYTNPTRKVV